MTERWKLIKECPAYSVSSAGRVRNDHTGRFLRVKVNHYGVAGVGLMKAGRQVHRGLALLVANAFLQRNAGPFDTPINLNGDRLDCHVENLAWRPRWHAVLYNRQFHERYPHPIITPIRNLMTGDEFENSWVAVTHYGVLEKDLVLSILNRTYCWPIYQEFELIE